MLSMQDGLQMQVAKATVSTVAGGVSNLWNKVRGTTKKKDVDIFVRSSHVAGVEPWALNLLKDETIKDLKSMIYREHGIHVKERGLFLIGDNGELELYDDDVVTLYDSKPST